MPFQALLGPCKLTTAGSADRERAHLSSIEISEEVKKVPRLRSRGSLSLDSGYATAPTRFTQPTGLSHGTGRGDSRRERGLYGVWAEAASRP